MAKITVAPPAPTMEAHLILVLDGKVTDLGIRHIEKGPNYQVRVEFHEHPENCPECAYRKAGN